MQVTAEELGYWYLRLNGFLTITNFLIHQDVGFGTRTESDILGVRFPNRKENPKKPMLDHDRLTHRWDKGDKSAELPEKPFIAIVEAKTGRCGLNGPWTKPERKNMHRVLRAIGTFNGEELEDAAQALYKHGIYESEAYYVSLLCFGKYRNNDHEYVSGNYKDVPQILWDDIKRFIFRRFDEYWKQKKDHDQWDDAGKDLYTAFENSKRDDEKFVRSVDVVKRYEKKQIDVDTLEPGFIQILQQAKNGGQNVEITRNREIIARLKPTGYEINSDHV